MIEILTAIAPLYIVIVVGMICGRTVADDNWVAVLNRYGLYVAFPALAFDALSSSSIAATSEPLWAGLYTLLGLSVCMVVAKSLSIAAGAPVHLANLIAIGVPFSNNGYLGYPLIAALDVSLSPYVAVQMGAYLVALFAVGIILLELDQMRSAKQAKMVLVVNVLWRLAKSPLLISVVAGLCVSWLNISLPEYAATPIHMLAKSASPVVLISLGVFVGRMHWNHIKERLPIAFAMSAASLIVMPFLARLYTGLLPIGMPGKAVIVLETAMPFAITPFALSEYYRLPQKAVAVSIVVSTLISIVTIPIVVEFFI